MKSYKTEDKCYFCRSKITRKTILFGYDYIECSSGHTWYYDIDGIRHIGMPIIDKETYLNKEKNK